MSKLLTVLSTCLTQGSQSFDNRMQKQESDPWQDFASVIYFK